MRRIRRRGGFVWCGVSVLGAALCAGGEASARPGDLDEPLRIPAFPFFHASTTVGRAARIARYSCAASTSEAGPEVVYRLDVARSGTLAAFVGGDGGGVDVDVHL